MSSKKTEPTLLPKKDENPRLNIIVALLDNKDFIADSRRFWKRYRAQSARIGSNRREWFRQAEKFMNRYLDPFMNKWLGAYPAHHELLSPPIWQEKERAIKSARWGIIPVFPWTSQDEAITHLKKIQQKIGKTHIDHFKAARLAQIAEWLSEFFISTRTGKPPTLLEIAKVVWKRRKGLSRPTRKESMRRLSEDRENSLMHRYLSEGKTYKEAERLTFKSARGSEAPAAAMVRMALKRLKKRKNQSIVTDPKKTDQLALAVTQLLCKLPASISSPRKSKAIYGRAVDLRNLLIPLGNKA